MAVMTSSNAHLLRRYCYSRESLSMIVLIVSAQLTLLANWEPMLMAYKRLPDVVWLQDTPMPVVMPLSLPGLSWNPYGKIVGTRASIALSYTTHNISAGNSALARPSVGEFCGASCTTGVDQGSMAPQVTVQHLMGVGNSSLTVQVPWATNTIELSDLWGVATVVLQETVVNASTATGDAQLWGLKIDNIPMLTSLASANGTVINRTGSLSTVRFTPRLRSGTNATLLKCQHKKKVPTFLATRLEFVLAEDVGCSDGELIRVTSVGILGRVGGPTGHEVTPFLQADNPVETCLQVGSGILLCNNCSVAKCLGHFITG